MIKRNIPYPKCQHPQNQAPTPKPPQAPSPQISNQERSIPAPNIRYTHFVGEDIYFGREYIHFVREYIHFVRNYVLFEGGFNIRGTSAKP